MLLLLITSVQGTYNYIPKTHHVSRVHNGAVLLWLQFIVDVLHDKRFVFLH